MKLYEQIKRYSPWNEQEERDKKIILDFLDKNPDAFYRSNLLAHMTASSWAVNESMDKLLMVYHRIYNSWSWTGGHADGDEDLLRVAVKELKEETGVSHVRPLSENIFSLEVLTVDGHEKHGSYVPSHLHLNLTYLIEADENDALKVCEDENTAVSWFSLEDALKASTEPWFVERIYRKLNQKLEFIKKMQ